MINQLKISRVWIIPTAISLMFSAYISSGLNFQDDEEIPPNCIQIGPFEEHIRASLQNRILQLQSSVDLTPKQVSKLKVMVKGVMKSQADYHTGWFYYGNPLLSEKWKKALERTLDDSQTEALTEFDLQVRAKRTEAKLLYNKNEKEAELKAGFVASNLQLHLYLTNEQTDRIREMLTSHLEGLGDRKWDPSMSVFYESNRETLDSLLTESQRVFLDGDSLKNGIGDGAVWNDEWRKAKCTDCHAS